MGGRAMRYERVRARRNQLSLMMLALCALAFGASGCDALLFVGAGELTQGVECVLFHADAGRLYLLDNMGDFEVGDRVIVAGVLDPQCATICQQGDGCIHANTIVAE